MALENIRNNVFPKIMFGIRTLVVSFKDVQKEIGIEDVIAHRGQGLARLSREGVRLLRLFIKLYYPVVVIDGHHAELAGRFFDRYFEARDCEV